MTSTGSTERLPVGHRHPPPVERRTVDGRQGEGEEDKGVGSRRHSTSGGSGGFGKEPQGAPDGEGGTGRRNASIPLWEVSAVVQARTDQSL